MKMAVVNVSVYCQTIKTTLLPWTMVSIIEEGGVGNLVGYSAKKEGLGTCHSLGA